MATFPDGFQVSWEEFEPEPGETPRFARLGEMLEGTGRAWGGCGRGSRANLRAQGFEDEVSLSFSFQLWQQALYLAAFSVWRAELMR